jgi:ABC-2 type transport system ATP-binding protein
MSVDQTWMIEARGLSKFYGSFAAVLDVSFRVPQGQVAAFLGPNGAGKSTTLKILTGYLTPSAGSASIAGLDVAANRIEAAARVGYLPENGPLYPEMTPLELLRFFGEARGLEDGRLRSRIDAVVQQCALQGVLEKSIFKLSKGYRQRVGMAQALLHEPDILIMDEPTSGLDPNQIRDVRELIRTLGKTKTILLSTHILQEVEAVADHVILIHEGRVIFDGTPREMAAGRSLERAFYELTSNRPVAARATAASLPDATGSDGAAGGAATQSAPPVRETPMPGDSATDDLRDDARAGGAE